MSLLAIAFSVSIGLNIATVGTVVALWRARDRTYRYATDLAARFGPTDIRGNAYSDMATVIVLDGKAEPKAWGR